jgi:hypothetical protein
MNDPVERFVAVVDHAAPVVPDFVYLTVFDQLHEPFHRFHARVIAGGGDRGVHMVVARHEEPGRFGKLFENHKDCHVQSGCLRVG